jgi:hypothetical protein
MKAGAGGYSHILVNMPLLFRLCGIEDRAFEKIIVDNPRAPFA